jgi:hypothetical protein
MNKYTILITGLLLFSYNGYTQSDFQRKINKVKLSTINDTTDFAFENHLSIIYLEKKLVIQRIKEHLAYDRLCDLRRLNYNKILKTLSNNDSSFYVIEQAISPEILSRIGETSSLFVISGKYIPPYGFNIELDTLKKIHLSKYFTWMISDVVRDGRAKIYNKKSKQYEKIVYYEINSVLETLKFKDKRSFFFIDSFSDIISPDIECEKDKNK